MEDLKYTIAKNLSQCRKACGFTQLQVAEKLNYSDKAVSKWERGESLPDIAVLVELAELYGVTLDFLVQDSVRKPQEPPAGRRRRRILVVAMSCILVWVVAVAVYFLALMLGAEGKGWLLTFVWAIPADCVICVVFSALWGNKYLKTLSVSLLVWTCAAALYLTVPLRYNWSFFVLAGLLQALTVFWFLLRTPRRKFKR